MRRDPGFPEEGKKGLGVSGRHGRDQRAGRDEVWHVVGWVTLGLEPTHHCDCCFCSIAKSCSTFCDPHGLQHTRLPCPSLSPGVCLNSYPYLLLLTSTLASRTASRVSIYPTSLCVVTLGRWCHPPGYHIIYCPFLILPSIFPSIRDFSSESGLCIWWPKYICSQKVYQYKSK